MEAAKKLEDKPVLVPGRMKGSEFERTLWCVTVEKTVTREILTDNDFWAHAAQRLKPYDRIEVRQDEGDFFAEYLVLAVGRGWAQVHELSFHKLTEDVVDAPEHPDYYVKYCGPHSRFCVIRRSDGEKIKDQMEKGEANIWLTEYLKTTS